MKTKTILSVIIGIAGFLIGGIIWLGDPDVKQNIFEDAGRFMIGGLVFGITIFILYQINKDRFQ